MRRIVLLTHADLRQRAGDVSLILRRAEAFFKQLNMSTKCILLQKQNYVPFTSEWFISVFAEDNNAIRREIYSLEDLELVMLYGRKALEKITFIKKILQRMNSRARVIIDIQGALEEAVEYSNGMQKIISYSKYLLKRSVFKIALNRADGAFVVSDELSEYCSNHLQKSKTNDFRIFKVRCGVVDVIGMEQKVLWRNKIRRSLSIEDNIKVFVFSGYRMAWQKIDETIEKFKEFDKHDKESFFAFYCNTDRQFEAMIRNSFPRGNYIIKHLNSEEYFKYLCACDVGFLFRDYNVTNQVAFPNKFSDYLNSGLIVAINKAIPEPYRVLQRSGIEYIDLDSDTIDIMFDKIVKRKEDLPGFYKKTEDLCSKELLYSSQIKRLNISF
ncbi:MAG: glycosyltransferase family 4 protein [SAR324 cluster bacterium]|uniref:Glycosyltransferase family 4 protein n=1 Tax=SAR324 cluster bacterium TaxID=2024889 RepID=A0A7X9FTY8_9DELT|nr:glycosyltransferase family 4 protein [SAR324 cluster bacterium]